MQTKMKPAWQFLWIYEDDYHDGSQSQRRNWKGRVYRARSLEEACDKMVRWIESRRKDVYVDYEARAEHVRYNQKQHEKKYPNLNVIDHRISAFVN